MRDTGSRTERDAEAWDAHYADPPEPVTAADVLGDDELAELWRARRGWR